MGLGSQFDFPSIVGECGGRICAAGTERALRAPAWTRLAEKIGVSNTIFQRKKSAKRALDTELHTTKNLTKALHKTSDKVAGK